MDPLAHTLFGAALGESGLHRQSRFARAVLIVGANLPDVDAFTTPLGRDTMLWVRRGWTHGVLALVLWPFVLVGLFILLDRLRPNADRPLRPGRLLALASMAVVSHPLLDVLNTYGVRFLMPFDGRWFYIDGLLVVDPFFWLLAGAAVFLAHSARTWQWLSWLALAGLITILVFTNPIPVATRVIWLAAVGALAAGRAFKDRAPSAVWTARASLGVLLLYIGAMIAGNRVACGQAERWLADQGHPQVVRCMARNVAAAPAVREVVVETPGKYHELDVRWLSGAVAQSGIVAINDGSPEVAAARASPGVRGLVGWARFPFYTVEETADGFTVHITDARYTLDHRQEWGNGRVRLDRELRVVTE